MDRDGGRGGAGAVRPDAGRGGRGARRGRPRSVGAPGVDGDAGVPAQLGGTGGGFGRAGAGDRRRVRVARGDVRLPRPAVVRVVARAPALGAGVHRGVHVRRDAGRDRAGAAHGTCARSVALRHLRRDPDHADRDDGGDLRAGPVPVRLPPLAGGFPGAVADGAGGGVDAGARRRVGVLARRAPAGAPGDRGRREHGRDGGAERLRRGQLLRRDHVHDRDLPLVARAGRPGRGDPACGDPHGLRARRARARAGRSAGGVVSTTREAPGTARSSGSGCAVGARGRHSRSASPRSSSASSSPSRSSRSGR